MLGLLPAATPGAALHVVFSAECTPLFDWHSVGLFYSFYASGQHGISIRTVLSATDSTGSHREARLETMVARRRADDGAKLADGPRRSIEHRFAILFLGFEPSHPKRHG